MVNDTTSADYFAEDNIEVGDSKVTNEKLSIDILENNGRLSSSGIYVGSEYSDIIAEGCDIYIHELSEENEINSMRISEVNDLISSDTKSESSENERSGYFSLEEVNNDLSVDVIEYDNSSYGEVVMYEKTTNNDNTSDEESCYYDALSTDEDTTSDIYYPCVEKVSFTNETLVYIKDGVFANEKVVSDEDLVSTFEHNSGNLKKESSIDKNTISSDNVLDNGIKNNMNINYLKIGKGNRNNIVTSRVSNNSTNTSFPSSKKADFTSSPNKSESINIENKNKKKNISKRAKKSVLKNRSVNNSTSMKPPDYIHISEKINHLYFVHRMFNSNSPMQYPVNAPNAPRSMNGHVGMASELQGTCCANNYNIVSEPACDSYFPMYQNNEFNHANGIPDFVYGNVQPNVHGFYNDQYSMKPHVRSPDNLPYMREMVPKDFMPSLVPNPMMNNQYYPIEFGMIRTAFRPRFNKNGSRNSASHRRRQKMKNSYSHDDTSGPRNFLKSNI